MNGKIYNILKFSYYMKGVYLIGYIETKEEQFLKSAKSIKNAVSKVSKFMGLNVVCEKYHVFKSPIGITYCFILSQSHFVVHTWPEDYKVFFDIFTCNKELDEKKCFALLSKEFKGEVKEARKVVYK